MVKIKSLHLAMQALIHVEDLLLDWWPIVVCEIGEGVDPSRPMKNLQCFYGAYYSPLFNFCQPSSQDRPFSANAGERPEHGE